MADLIVNHISSRSPQFLDYDERGDASPYSGMFLTYTRVFGEGATESDLLQLYRPRPGLPFTKYELKHGEQRLLWTTFTGEQIDIDIHHPEGKRYLDTILKQFQAAGIRAIRLDAVGYAIKKAGNQLLHDSQNVRLHCGTDGSGAHAWNRGSSGDPQSLPRANRNR